MDGGARAAGVTPNRTSCPTAASVSSIVPRSCSSTARGPTRWTRLDRAFEQLSRPPGHPAVGDALYRLAELLRLRGEFTRAEEAYRRASEQGRDPQPGLARLRLAQGQTAVAASAIRRAVDEAHDRVDALAVVGGRTSRSCSRSTMSTRLGPRPTSSPASPPRSKRPSLEAMSQHATALVLLAEGDARAALGGAAACVGDLARPRSAVRGGARATRGRPRRAGSSATRTARRSSSTRPRARSARSARRSIWPTSSGSPTTAGGAHAGALSAASCDVLTVARNWDDQPGDRYRAGDQREDRGPSRREHLHQARCVVTRSAATAYAYEHGLVRQAYTE